MVGCFLLAKQLRLSLTEAYWWYPIHSIFRCPHSWWCSFPGPCCSSRTCGVDVSELSRTHPHSYYFQPRLWQIAQWACRRPKWQQTFWFQSPKAKQCLESRGHCGMYLATSRNRTKMNKEKMGSVVLGRRCSLVKLGYWLADLGEEIHTLIMRQFSQWICIWLKLQKMLHLGKWKLCISRARKRMAYLYISLRPTRFIPHPLTLTFQ